VEAQDLVRTVGVQPRRGCRVLLAVEGLGLEVVRERVCGGVGGDGDRGCCHRDGTPVWCELLEAGIESVPALTEKTSSRVPMSLKAVPEGGPLLRSVPAAGRRRQRTGARRHRTASVHKPEALRVG
jgi:hypothetical protein